MAIYLIKRQGENPVLLGRQNVQMPWKGEGADVDGSCIHEQDQNGGGRRGHVNGRMVMPVPVIKMTLWLDAGYSNLRFPALLRCCWFAMTTSTTTLMTTCWLVKR